MIWRSMLNNKKNRQLAFSCIFSISLAAILVITTQFYPYNSQLYVQNIITATPRSNKTQWIYKTIDGKVYRRLYDLTDQKYLTNWELVK